jgi:hypothetical protein
MPTINEVRKMKRSLEDTILSSLRKFEESGVLIDYINIDRAPSEDDMRLHPVDVEPYAQGGEIQKIRISLRLDVID